MSTIIVNLNDTIATNDTIVVKMSKVAEILQPVVKGAETNWQDVIIAVAITFAVCATIIIVARIVKSAFLSWKDKVIKAQEQERTDRENKETAEYKRKQEADRENRTNMLEDEKRKRTNMIEDEERKRTNMIEDEERKRKSDILDKKLRVLCDTCYELSKDEPKNVVKKYDDKAVANYIAALDDALGTKSTSKTGTDE